MFGVWVPIKEGKMGRHDDVRELKRVLADLGIRRICNMPDEIVGPLYNRWSEENYSASWISPTAESAESFHKWATKTPLQEAIEQADDKRQLEDGFYYVKYGDIIKIEGRVDLYEMLTALIDNGSIEV